MSFDFLPTHVSVGYLTAFLALSITAAFALGWFLRKAQGPREGESPPARGSWERATTRAVDFGPSLLGASVPPAQEQCWTTVTVPLDEYERDRLKYERMAGPWKRVVIVARDGKPYASISGCGGEES